MKRTIERLTLVVTGDCNLSCPYCGQAQLRRCLRGYHMNLDEVSRFIERCRDLEVRYQTIRLCGGEPTLWKHIREGVPLIKASGIADGLDMYTNGIRTHVIDDVVDHFREINVSVYENNVVEARLLKERHGEKVRLVRSIHRKLPDQPLPDTLPAICRCTAQGYVQGRFYACPNVYAKALHLGVDSEDPELSCSIDDDFGAHFEDHETSRFKHPICSVCLSNQKVWEQQAHTELKAE
jgi:hypothetical protein